MSHHQPWFEGFFTYLPNEFWRRVATPWTAAEVGFITRRLPPGGPARILDVPCGSGRHALALAARGHTVTGWDISEEAVAHAGSRAAEAGVPAAFHTGDMREVPGTGDFDAAISMGNCLGYLDAAGMAVFLRALYAALRPGGGLVLDYAAAAESVLPAGPPATRDTMAAGDITVRADTHYDLAAGCLRSRYRFTQGTHRLEATALHHVVTVAHLCDMLRAEGFADPQLYSDTDEAPFRLGDPRLLVHATRT
ncbi:MAG: class I SAM-dependent methyltransferase [Thermoleophilia bacterium]